MISERQVLNLLTNFLALVRADQEAKIASLSEKWQALGGLVLSIDGLKPEKGSPALYVVRETQLGLTLKAEILESGDQQTIATELLAQSRTGGCPSRGLSVMLKRVSGWLWPRSILAKPTKLANFIVSKKPADRFMKRTEP